MKSEREVLGETLDRASLDLRDKQQELELSRIEEVMHATQYSLIVTHHYALLINHFSLLTTYCSLLITRYSLLASHHPQGTTRHSLLTPH